MSTTRTLPPHLQILFQHWQAVLKKFRNIAPPVTAGDAPMVLLQDAEQLQALITAHMDALKNWAEEMETWFNDTLAAALGDPEQSVWKMRRIAPQLAGFFKQLHRLRYNLDHHGKSAALRFAAAKLDLILFDLLLQLRNFIEQVLAALSPQALAQYTGPVELNFHFRPDPGVVNNELLPWIHALTLSLSPCETHPHTFPQPRPPSWPAATTLDFAMVASAIAEHWDSAQEQPASSTDAPGHGHAKRQMARQKETQRPAAHKGERIAWVMLRILPGMLLKKPFS